MIRTVVEYYVEAFDEEFGVFRLEINGENGSGEAESEYEDCDEEEDAAAAGSAGPDDGFLVVVCGGLTMSFGDGGVLGRRDAVDLVLGDLDDVGGVASSGTAEALIGAVVGRRVGVEGLGAGIVDIIIGVIMVVIMIIGGRWDPLRHGEMGSGGD